MNAGRWGDSYYRLYIAIVTIYGGQRPGVLQPPSLVAGEQLQQRLLQLRVGVESVVLAQGVAAVGTVVHPGLEGAQKAGLWGGEIE